MKLLAIGSIWCSPVDSATLRECQMKQMPRRSYLPRWRTGGDHQDALVLHGQRLSSRTWNPTTCPWMKQLTWLRIVHSGDWCLYLVLRTPNGACHTRSGSDGPDCCTSFRHLLPWAHYWVDYVETELVQSYTLRLKWCVCLCVSIAANEGIE